MVRGTQQLLPTQEPRVTQSLVNDVMCGTHGGSGDVSPREKGRQYKGYFQVSEWLPFSKSDELLLKAKEDQSLAQYKEELSNSQKCPKGDVDSSGPWGC